MESGSCEINFGTGLQFTFLEPFAKVNYVTLVRIK